MPKIKLGIIGVGKIARDQHLPVLAQSPDFELIAAASRNAVVEGIANYPSLETMLAQEGDLQAVSLCTPPTAREADARLALARGLHVLLEKPPTATLGAARDLIARAAASVLCASWHSRHATGVEPARAWLSTRRIQSVAIAWKEDIRRWHPHQDWILDAGGMGVFDPGINALSILTALIADRIVLQNANLSVPANRQAPLAAELRLQTITGAPITAAFDFLQTGQQCWDIAVQTDDGALTLSEGGARLAIDNTNVPLITAPHQEYRGVYEHFARCIHDGGSDCDLRPLELVADAFLLGRRTITPAFTF